MVFLFELFLVSLQKWYFCLSFSKGFPEVFQRKTYKNYVFVRKLTCPYGTG